MKAFNKLQNKGEPLAAIAQLGERQTEDLKVSGSTPGLGISSFIPDAAFTIRRA